MRSLSPVHLGEMQDKKKLIFIPKINFLSVGSLRKHPPYIAKPNRVIFGINLQVLPSLRPLSTVFRELSTILS